jgi:hypothetical protein
LTRSTVVSASRLALNLHVFTPVILSGRPCEGAAQLDSHVPHQGSKLQLCVAGLRVGQLLLSPYSHISLAWSFSLPSDWTRGCWKPALAPQKQRHVHMGCLSFCHVSRRTC